MAQNPMMMSPIASSSNHAVAANNGTAMNPSHITPGGFMQAKSNQPLCSAPTSQAEVDSLMKKREIIEKTHPYEEELIANYADGTKAMPTLVPPAGYFHLLRDRAITKIRLSKAAEAGFAVYNLNQEASPDLDSKYGFSVPTTKRPRWQQ